MEKPWLEHYDDDVAETINPSQYSSIVELLLESCERNKRHTAMTQMGSDLSFARLEKLSRHVATYLQQVLDLQPGDRIAIMLPNILQYPVFLLAALRAGLVVVNVNPLYTATEIHQQLTDASVKATVVLENFAATLAEALEHLPLEYVIVTGIGDLMGGLKGALINFAVKHIKHMVPKYNIESAVTLKEVLRVGKSLTFHNVLVQPDDLAFLQYTGGTTGVPKGAMLTHRNIIANVMQVSTWVGKHAEAGKDTALAALPFYHIYSLTVCCFSFLFLGVRCLLIANPRDLDDFMATLQRDPVTIFAGLNTLFNAMMNHPKIAKLDFSGLHYSVAGGMPTTHDVAERWEKLTGVPLIEGYGLTEASPVVSVNPLGSKHFNGSVGLPLPSTEVSIRDDNGQELSSGEIGELWVRGPQVMKGYWHRPDMTKEVIDSEGWLHTGDIARLDEKGFIYLVDRKKDMIIVSGFNVYPTEIEDVIAELPDVLEVAVVGVPDDQTGEAVKAFIVANEEGVDEDEITEHCRKFLTAYKIPHLFEFRDELPKSNVGKVLRKDLR